ncbi:hypothetical protein Tco_0914565 [Tanacetum coccineum]
MTSRSNKYKRMKKIPQELRLELTFPLLEQDPSLLRRKRKAIELEPKTYIADLHCNRTLPKRVSFMKNLVIETHEHRLFFIDAFGEPSFQRMSDIQKVETETLFGYKVIALNV